MTHVFLAALIAATAAPAAAQDLFEIQVYPYLTVPAGRTMVEVHSNYFASGTLIIIGPARRFDFTAPSRFSRVTL